jgi:dihydroxyacetone kinase
VREASVFLGLPSRHSDQCQERGAELGDKTLLDVLVPALDELDDGASAGHLHAFLERRVAEIASWRSRRGRAAWHQERSIGLKDPGSVAVAYALAILVDDDPAA